MGALIPLLQKLLVWVGSNILVALGLSFITFTGITVSLNVIRNYVVSSFNSLPADMFALLMMAGCGQGIGIIFGAFAFRATMIAASRLTAMKSGGGS